MAVLISGKLIGPNGDPRPGVTIMLTAVKTSSTVVHLAPSSSTTGTDGSYSLSVEVGVHNVMIKAGGRPFEKVGRISIYSDSKPGTLNDYLTVPGENELTPDIIAIVDDMRKATSLYAEQAKSSAASAKSDTDRAVVAADIAQNIADANTYYITPEDPDGTIAGLAGTPNGKSFRVAQGMGSINALIYYINNNGIAEPISSIPGTNAVTEVRSRLKTIRDKFRNAFIDSKGRVGAGLDASMAWCALALQSKKFNVTADDDKLSMQIIPQKGKITFSKNGKVAMEIQRNGQVRIASLEVLSLFAHNYDVDLDGKDISGSIVPTGGGFRDDTAGALANYVGLHGMGSAYGNVQGKEPGIALRRLGTVLTRDESKPWMSAMVESPVIWFDDIDMKYHMVFTAYSGTYAKPGSGSIGHATSIDLMNWSVNQNALLSGSNIDGSPDKSGCTGPYMLKGDDGIYYLFYIGLPAPGYENGIKRLCLATSPSLNGPWERHGVMIDKNPAHPWRSDDVYHASIVNRNGTYYLFFNSKGVSATGGNDSQGNERIGYATSKSLLGPWVVDDANAPIINTENNTWKSLKVGDPSVYRDGNLWFMNYFAYDGNADAAYDSIAVTTDEEFPLGWREYGQPVLSPITTALNEKKYLHKPFIIYVGGRKYHFTTGVGDSNRVIVAYASGAGVDDRFAPGISGVIRNVITPSLDGGEAVEEFLPEVSSRPVMRVGQLAGGEWVVYRAAANGMVKSKGVEFDGRNIAFGSDSQLMAGASDGFVYIPSINGTPTGTPSQKNGKHPICVDATNKKLWVYISGSWFSTNLS